jgi:HPr kinase/phosphorylase
MSDTMNRAVSEAIHASCVLIGDCAVLIRGEAGTGKTTLALALLEAARAQGVFARLVSDDRTLVSTRGGRLVARPHPRLAGAGERRGLGLTPLAHEGAGVVGLVIDCGDAPERLPEPQDLVCEIAGVTLPRLQSARGAGDAAQALAALSLFRGAQ